MKERPVEKLQNTAQKTLSPRVLFCIPRDTSFLSSYLDLPSLLFSVKKLDIEFS